MSLIKVNNMYYIQIINSKTNITSNKFQLIEINLTIMPLKSGMSTLEFRRQTSLLQHCQTLHNNLVQKTK